VQVEAASLFEAAIRGLAVLKEHPWCGQQLQAATVLEVRPVTRSLGRVLLSRLLRWLDGRADDAADQVRRYQLKVLLSRDSGQSERRKRRERWH
jgi:hypothetical protein